MSNDNKKYSRLNLFIRKTIEALLDKGNSFTRIAEEIEVSVSTVSREVKRNRTLTGKNSAQYDVEHSYAALLPLIARGKDVPPARR